MAIAYDNNTNFGTLTGTLSAYTISHTPVGTPGAVVVTVVGSSTGTYSLTGITYGGVALTLIDNAQDAAGETGQTWVYFLGSSVPSGTQDAVITFDSTVADVAIAVTTFTSGGTVYARDQDKLQGDQADPQVTLSTLGDSCLAVGAIYTGLNTPTDLTPLSGMSSLYDKDQGANCALHYYQTSPSTSDFTWGFTGALDDVALVAFNMSETAPSSTALRDIIGMGILAFPR